MAFLEAVRIWIKSWSLGLRAVEGGTTWRYIIYKASRKLAAMRLPLELLATKVAKATWVVGGRLGPLFFFTYLVLGSEPIPGACVAPFHINGPPAVHAG